MTAAQREYFIAHGIDPWALEWDDADVLGFERFGKSEAAILPDGRVLLCQRHAALARLPRNATL